MTLERIAAIVSVLVILCTVVATFAVQMERLARVREDVQKLDKRQEQIMQAIGEIENSRWRERHK